MITRILFVAAAACLVGAPLVPDTGAAATNTAPTISGSPSSSILIGERYWFRPTSADPDGDTLTFSMVNRPSWISWFNKSNGAFIGTPGPNDAGTYSNIEIRVSDGQASASLVFSITVDSTAGNSPPTISGTPPGSITAGEYYWFRPKSGDADGDTLTFRMRNKPSWIAWFNKSNGAFMGTPGAGDVGSYPNIQISVSDGTQVVSLPAFTINVLAAGSGTGSATLSWTAPTKNTDGTALTNLAGYIVYWGTTSGSYSHSVSLNNPGLTSYVIDGLAAGTYYFALQAVDSSGVQSSFSNQASKTIP